MEMHIPENWKGWVTGSRGSELRRLEAKTGTCIFMKNPGVFAKGVREKASSEKGFDTDRLIFKDGYFVRE